MMKNYVLQKKQKVLFCKKGGGVPWHPWHPRCRRLWYRLILRETIQYFYFPAIKQLNLIYIILRVFEND